MKKFIFLPHTADAEFEAYGRTLEEVFTNSALAFINLITNPAGIKTDVIEELKVTGHDLENLLYKFLEELLFLFETKYLLFPEPVVTRVKQEGSEWVLTAVLHGGEFNQKVNEIRSNVKAVTYNNVRVKRSDDHWIAGLVLDL